MQQARLSYAPDQHWNPLVLDTRGNPEVRAVSRWRAGGFPVHSPARRGGMGDTAAAGAEAAIRGAEQGMAQGGPIGAAIGAVTDLIGSLLTTSLSGKQKQSTTAIANDAEVLMQQNLSAYLASPRSQADQAAALQNYDQLWNWLVTNCATPSLADAGVACVDDRQRGACKWDKPAGSWTASMGPRSRDRGIAMPSTAMTSEPPASMGPRSRDRGIYMDVAEAKQNPLLQWGRDHVIAESSYCLAVS